MRVSLFIFLSILLASCEDLSVFRRDQKNIHFSKNIRKKELISSGEIKVVTWNIKLGFCQICDPFSDDIGGDKNQLDQIVNLIKKINPDIICLQEVAHQYALTLVENQIEYIAKKLNYNYAYGVNTAIQNPNNLEANGFSGNAILSKYDIVSISNDTTRFIDFYNQNNCLSANIRISENNELTILNSHLASGSTNAEKRLQINKILEIAKRTNEPKIIAGDFNIPYSTNNEFLSLIQKDFSNTLENSKLLDDNIFTYGTFVSGSIIDYIFVSPEHFSINTSSISPENLRHISDHFSYLTTLIIK